LQADQPIGVFDSGIGGLTVAKSLINALPNESIIYFGDTVHLPYGDKPVHAVQKYTKEIVDFLLKQKVKMIVIACHSASAAAYEMLKNYVGDRVLLVNMIDPAVSFLKKNYEGKRVGLIGTKLTIGTGVYSNKLAFMNSQIDLRALETPSLASIIEEDCLAPQLIDDALAESLSSSDLQDIHALVLGCTHYPVIKNKINSFYENKVNIVDPAEIVADYISSLLKSENLLSSKVGPHFFYVSSYADCFAQRTKMFFGKEVTVKELNIFR